MKKDNLLSIGALSKQTGVHIKSLRYYDSLGILRPAYVDPSSGYRYYNLQQIPVVGAIQLCIDLGISLKHFTEYYSESSGQLRYARLIERGTALAKEKIQTLQERLSNLEKLQADIERSELIQQSENMARCKCPAMDVWLTPCTSNAAEPHIFTQFHSLIRTVENSGLTINYFAGRLLHCQRNQTKLFFLYWGRYSTGNAGDSRSCFSPSRRRVPLLFAGTACYCGRRRYFPGTICVGL